MWNDLRGNKKVLFLAAAVALLLGGCSSQHPDSASPNGDTENDDNWAQDKPSAETDTDNVPQPSPEVVPPPVMATENCPQGPRAPASEEEDWYIVKRYDTLMKIAFMLYGNMDKWHTLFSLNTTRIRDSHWIYPGQKIKIEKPNGVPQIDRNGEPYLIHLGDTLAKISNKVYGTSAKWRSLWDNNRQLISNPNRIFRGFTLYYIPDSNYRQLSSVSPPSYSGHATPGRRGRKKGQRSETASAQSPQNQAQGQAQPLYPQQPPQTAAPQTQALGAPAGNVDPMAAPAAPVAAVPQGG